MNTLIHFPQRQHLEFRKLVFKSVYDAARIKGLDLESYIANVYAATENPMLFSSSDSLMEIYSRFKDLIESTVSSDPDANKLSNAHKTYLCFRVYLHSVCMGRQTMPKSDAELYLLDALKEYFHAEAKVLSCREKLKIMRYLKHLKGQATTQPD